MSRSSLGNVTVPVEQRKLLMAVRPVTGVVDVEVTEDGGVA